MERMQSLKQTLGLTILGFAIVAAACSGSQPIIELLPDEKLTGVEDKATFSPTSTPTHSPLPAYARPIPVSDGVLHGAATQKVQPVYPLEAQAKGITGEVKIHVSIDQEGYLREAVALSGHMLLQAAALTAVKHWRWRPTMYDGPPIYITGTVTFHFPPRS